MDSTELTIGGLLVVGSAIYLTFFSGRITVLLVAVVGFCIFVNERHNHASSNTGASEIAATLSEKTVEEVLPLPKKKNVVVVVSVENVVPRPRRKVTIVMAEAVVQARRSW